MVNPFCCVQRCISVNGMVKTDSWRFYLCYWNIRYLLMLAIHVTSFEAENCALMAKLPADKAEA